MRLPHDCLILVADGRKMLLLRNKGTADAPQLDVEYGEEQPNPSDSDQKTDMAGRRPMVGGLGQSSVSEADYHQQAEDRFAARIADHLNSLALENDLGALVVVAAPRTLGVLRRHFHKQVLPRIIAQVEKNLTGHTTDQIARMLVSAEEPV